MYAPAHDIITQTRPAAVRRAAETGRAASEALETFETLDDAWHDGLATQAERDAALEAWRTHSDGWKRAKRLIEKLDELHKLEANAPRNLHSAVHGQWLRANRRCWESITALIDVVL